MKFLFDFLPVLLFFISYKVYGFIVATGVLMCATVAQIAWMWFRHKKVEKMHIVSLVLVLVFGGATVFFDDPLFFQWKVSIINWLFALAFLGSQFFGSKNLTHRMYGQAITLTKDIWFQLNIGWVIFFTAIGFINLWVMNNFDEATWVNFKLFGVLGLTFTFIILQVFYMKPYIAEDETHEEQQKD